MCRGITYDLTGPEALTHGEMAEKLSTAVGREIRYVDVPQQAMMEALVNVGLPCWQVDGLIEDYAPTVAEKRQPSPQEFTLQQARRPDPLMILRATTLSHFLSQS